jgi:hypothetical protein
VTVAVAGIGSPAAAPAQFTYLTVTGTIPPAPGVYESVGAEVEVLGYGFVVGHTTVNLIPTESAKGGETWDIAPLAMDSTGTWLKFNTPFQAGSIQGAYQILVTTPYGVSASPTMLTVTYAGPGQS